MMNYVLRRALLAILSLCIVSMVSFSIIVSPPGGPTSGQPLHASYLHWMGMIIRGRFGYSSSTDAPSRVISLIESRLGMTVLISLSAACLTWAVAIPIGIYSAVHPHSVVDRIARFLGYLTTATPSFLLALAVMYFAWIWFDAPIGGLLSREYAHAPWNWAKLRDWLSHLPIPILLLGLSSTASMIRVMRSNLIDELHKPYVQAARARGLSATALLLKYPVRLALNPFASTVGYLLPQIVSGNIVLSVVFSLPTMGPLLVDALLTQDVYLAGALILLLSALTIVGTFLSDLLLLWIDPRIRMSVRE